MNSILNMTERTEKWKPIHDEFRAKIFFFVQPYLIFGPDKSVWDWWGGEYRPGPYKNIVELLRVTEEQSPLDL